MSLSSTQQAIFQGVSAYESGRLDDAIAIFQQAGSFLKAGLIAPRSTRSIGKLQSGLTMKPVMRVEKPESSSPFEENDSFLSAFVFCVSPQAQLADLSDEQLAACTSTLLFNLGLCYQVKGYSSCLVSARKMYEKAWACSCRYPPASPSDSILCLQMAIAMNLSSTLFQLGELEISHKWMTCLKAVLDFSNDQPMQEEAFFFSEEWLHFFNMACVLKQPCIAARAA